MTRVYFIKPIGMDGPIKIGTSISPDGRRKTLAKWCPFPLEIVAELDGGVKLEGSFHNLFAELHIGHEWFRAAPELVATVEKIAAGTFDIDSLPEPSSLAKRYRRAYYDTPEYRYGCSVRSRLNALQRRGLPWSHVNAEKIPNSNAELLAQRPSVEAAIARLTELAAGIYPQRKEG